MIELLTSAIWRKTLMALTGLLWCGFVLTHLTGNLLIFRGAEAYNTFSHALVSNPLLPIAEAVLVGSLLLHAASGAVLWVRNRQARPKKYAVKPKGPKAPPSFATRTMIVSGCLITAFLILHVATFKYGTANVVTYNGIAMRDVHGLVTSAFRQPAYAAWYLCALLFVGLHLHHGAASTVQTLGFNHPRYNALVKACGLTYAVVVTVGFLTLPISIFLSQPR